MANRVSDVCGESIIHVITSEISMQRAGRACVCALGNINEFDFSKISCFCNFDSAYLPCRLHPPPLDILCYEEDH